MVNGENADILGMYGKTDILAEKVKVSGLSKYTLSGSFQDAVGNTYTVTMTASKLTKTVVKTIKDGQLLICIDSVIYSAEGQKL